MSDFAIMPSFQAPDPATPRPTGGEPAPALLLIALGGVSFLTLAAGAIAGIDGLYNNAPAEAHSGAASFIAGCFLAAAVYTLRLLQLIEWRLRPAGAPAVDALDSRAAQPIV